ncbi:MAG: 8-oxo-dGTP diphosphatase [Anaerolineae bacterium]
MDRILGTLVYCVRGGAVLLMHRRKEPNLDLWVAPGGKVEPGESPYEGAIRELREETGYRAKALHFRGLITEVSPRPDWQWMLFVYVATDFEGDLRGDGREGLLRWWPAEAVPGLPLPPADAIFYPHVIDLSQPFYHAKYVYDAALALTDVIVYPNAANPSLSGRQGKAM